MAFELSDLASPAIGALIGGGVGGSLFGRRGLGAALGGGFGVLQNRLLGDNAGVAPALMTPLGMAAGATLLARRSPAAQKALEVFKSGGPWRQLGPGAVPLAMAAGGGLAAGSALGGGINSLTDGHGGAGLLGALGGGVLAHRGGYKPWMGGAIGGGVGILGSRILKNMGRQQQQQQQQQQQFGVMQ